MGQENKNWKAKAVVGGLLVLGVVSVIYSYSKPLMTSTKSVIVSDNKSNASNLEEDKPLQVVKSEETDAIEGFNTMMGQIGDNEALVKIGMTKKDIEERFKVLNKNNEGDLEKFYKEVKGKTYKLNLSTLEKSPFDFGDWGIISPDGTKYSYGVKENGEQSYYIVDIKSNTKKKINMKGNIWVSGWTGNSKYIVGISYGENQSVVVYDLENDKIKEFKDDTKNISPLGGIYSTNGKDVYFVESSITVGGIYRLNTDDGKMEPVMELPSNEKDKSKSHINSQGFAVIDKGEKIVFEGALNGEDGLFIYDVKSKKTNKVTQSIGSSLTPFWISPDENKIVYATYSGKDNNGVWSISAAKFKGNDLVNKILLLKDLDYYSLIDQKNMVCWNNDSNKVTIFESKNSRVDGGAVPEKGIIHRIYFK